MGKNLKNMDFEDYDDVVCFTKMTPKAKKLKGHQSKHQNNRDSKWDDIIQEDLEDGNYVSMLMAQKTATSLRGYTDGDRPKYRQEDPFKNNYIRSINNININYRGVIKLEKINSQFKGKPSFGIKFYFKNNNSFKTIWFDQRQKERDMVFNQELEFFENFKNHQNKNNR